jgi:hypothetical protein
MEIEERQTINEWKKSLTENKKKNFDKMKKDAE